MTWIAVTVPRRKSGVGMPERCVYCNGPAEQDAVLRTRRELSYSKSGLTTTHIDEHLAIEIPYCRAHAAQNLRIRMEIRRTGFILAAVFGLLGLLLVLVGLDAPAGVRVFIGILVGIALAALALLGTGALVRRVPRYRDWGAGLLGIDMAAGPDAMTFRFTNPTYAALFRTRNGTVR